MTFGRTKPELQNNLLKVYQTIIHTCMMSNLAYFFVRSCTKMRGFTVDLLVPIVFLVSLTKI